MAPPLLNASCRDVSSTPTLSSSSTNVHTFLDSHMCLIFDSHLDLAWNALTWKRDLRRPLADLNAAEQGLPEKFRGKATTCLPELRRARVAVCLGTAMARVPHGDRALHGESLDFATHEQAFAFAQGQLAYYRALEAAGELRLIQNANQLQAHWDQWKSHTGTTLPTIGLIFAMEGADAIVDPEHVEAWFAQGLRCVSLVHYGTSQYAVGTGHEGPLRDRGREFLSQCARVGMIVDLTHLCDESFFDVVESFDGPVCATHQNCRALVPGQRQFTDEQIQVITRRGGVLGVACDSWMLYPGWVRGETAREVVGMEALGDHIDHICQLTGNADHVCIGSDLDGGFGTEQTPVGLDSIADLQKLVGILSHRGYSSDDVRRVMGENWLRFFLAHLPAE